MKWQLLLVMAFVVGTTTASEGDWWRSITTKPGVIVDDPDSAGLQKLKLGGYTHVQWASVDGRSANQNFSYQVPAEVRRTRLSLKGQAFDWLSFNTHVNISEDDGRRGGGVEVDYFGVFLADVEIDLSGLVPNSGLDRLSIAYGKRKLTELNEEDETSINSVLTVERSSFSGFLVPFREATSTTGAWMTLGKGADTLSLGVFTTDASPEFGTWDDGTVVVGSWEHDFSKAWDMDEAVLSIGGGLQDVKAGDEVYSPWEWIFTPWLRLRDGPWEFRASGALGDLEGPTTTGGSFVGCTVMPAYWLVGGRLQVVARYEIMGSEAPRGVQTSFRYVREAGQPTNEAIPALAGGRGDFHQSIYTGLVWHVVPSHFTVLGGLEWEQLTSRSVNVYRGNTFWFATRFMF